MIARLLAGILVLACAAPAFAQGNQQSPSPQQPPAEEQKPNFEEQVVVSASRSEQVLINAPAAVTIINSSTIQNSPGSNMGDLLRAVPGINVTQTSARDVNFTTRGATSTLATSQLALIDGRSIYLDFFGMVMWDLVPTNLHEIKRIEVVRGPASAVWGANAMSGVVNVILKTPRELARDGGGNSVTIGAGAINRNVTAGPGPSVFSGLTIEQDSGSLFYVNGSHSRAVDDRWSYKLSAGYFTQDPLPRPVGTIPNAFNTPYPPFANTGTSQPKFDGRVDYDVAGGNNGRLIFAGGVGGTEGIIHSGIGPFDIDNDSRLTYFTSRYEKGGRRIAVFTNLLNGNAVNLLAVGPTGQPLPLVFDTKTFDIEASDVRVIGTRHALTFGGNYRHNTFDISLAPGGDARNEGGGYIQDEIFLSDHFRWVVGGRVDKFSSIDDAVFSPRTTFMIKPDAAQTFRISFNRAFRAPSFINNNINTTILNQAQLSPQLAIVFPIRAIGNDTLKQETLTAYEIGYAGVIRDVNVSASVYWNNTEDGIYFTPNVFYSSTNPPPGWPLPPAFVPPNTLPAQYTYLNFGNVKDKGIELGVDTLVNKYVNVFANYSYQWKPVVHDLPAGTSIADINWPAKNRFNAGFDFSYSRFLGNMSVNYSGEAYWQDVLDLRYAGTTEDYTLVNGTFGVRWYDNRITTSLKITNLGNQQVQQHIFGDILKRQVVGELRVGF